MLTLGQPSTSSLAAVAEGSGEDDDHVEEEDASEAIADVESETPRPAPPLWETLSKSDEQLESQQLPFDCTDRSVNINQVRITLLCLHSVRERWGGENGFELAAVTHIIFLKCGVRVAYNYSQCIWLDERSVLACIFISWNSDYAPVRCV